MGGRGARDAQRPADVEIPAPVMRQIFLISPDLIFSAVASIETFPLKATSAPSLRKMLPIAATTALVLLVQSLSLLTAGFYLVVFDDKLYSPPRRFALGFLSYSIYAHSFCSTLI